MKVHYEILYRPTVLYLTVFGHAYSICFFKEDYTAGCHVSKNRHITRRHRLCFCVPGRTRRGTSPPQPTMAFGERRKLSQRGSGRIPGRPTNFLSFGASIYRMPLPRLESSYWRYSRSGKKWQTLNNLQVAVMLQS